MNTRNMSSNNVRSNRVSPDPYPWARAFSWLVLGWLASCECAWAGPGVVSAGPRFEISFPATHHPQPLSGRLLLVISRTEQPIVDYEHSGLNGPEYLGVDVRRLNPGEVVAVTTETLGYPFRSLKEVPLGDYSVQAIVTLYTEYHRSDGHTLLALNQWDGQEFTRNAGNLYSQVSKVHLDPASPATVRLNLTEVVATPAPRAADTGWVKNIRIESKLLSRFWGRPIYLGATILLPRGYLDNPNAQYPVIYEQKSHYLRDAPFSFTPEEVPEKEEERAQREQLGYETGYEFYQAWSSANFPRMIVARLIDPTPFYDFSSAMNSANNGPYGDAIMQELIPYIEQHFRIIREPYARELLGKSTGGRDALALQLFHPEFFGGAWIFYPWGIDYRRFCSGFNVYESESAFSVDWQETRGFQNQYEWWPLERSFPRTVDSMPVGTMRQYALHDAVQGGHSGVGAELNGNENALNSPVGQDGYPRPLYDELTGTIDHEVALYWRQHDLTSYVEANWPRIGGQLVGKLHFYVGDMDEYYRNYGVHHFQGVLKATQNPHEEGTFQYGSLKGHLWQPMTNAELVRMIAEHISRNAPQGATRAWME